MILLKIFQNKEDDKIMDSKIIRQQEFQQMFARWKTYGF